MSVYYNEIDPYAAQWLRNLIAAGHLPAGDVDERSITDVKADDIAGYAQCHFFAGIGGWAYALRLAGWPDDRPVWTGSPPCQPFSDAGRKRGQADVRHLWPELFRLVRECRPATLFGEQVAAAVGFDWIDSVQDDLEKEGYATGAVVLPACSVGAPHRRDRLWFVADADGEQQYGSRNIRKAGRSEPSDCLIMGNSKRSIYDGKEKFHLSKKNQARHASRACRAGPISSRWDECEWIPCRDGKLRPVEPGTFPLAHGVSARVGRLRAYGNAIVPQVAAEIISAFMESHHAHP